MNDAKIDMRVLTPALFNPGTATLFAIGLLGYGLIKLLGNDEENEDHSDAYNPISLKERASTAVATVDVPLEQPSVLPDARMEPDKDAVSEPIDAVQQETELSRRTDADRRLHDSRSEPKDSRRAWVSWYPELNFG